jgi:hypothetical protein
MSEPLSAIASPIPLLLIGLGLLGYLLSTSLSPRATLIPSPPSAPHQPTTPASPPHPDLLQDTGHPPHTFNC